MADHTLDAKGLNCPLPILKARKALKEVPAGTGFKRYYRSELVKNLPEEPEVDDLLGGEGDEPTPPVDPEAPEAAAAVILPPLGMKGVARVDTFS